MNAPGGPSRLAALIEPVLPATWPTDGFGDVGAIVRELPDPESLRQGDLVGVAPSAPRTRAFFARKTKEAHLAVRCAALLAKGYEAVGAFRDEGGREIACGRVP